MHQHYQNVSTPKRMMQSSKIRVKPIFYIQIEPKMLFKWMGSATNCHFITNYHPFAPELLHHTATLLHVDDFKLDHTNTCGNSLHLCSILGDLIRWYLGQSINVWLLQMSQDPPNAFRFFFKEVNALEEMASDCEFTVFIFLYLITNKKVHYFRHSIDFFTIQLDISTFSKSVSISH